MHLAQAEIPHGVEFLEPAQELLNFRGQLEEFQVMSDRARGDFFPRRDSLFLQRRVALQFSLPGKRAVNRVPWRFAAWRGFHRDGEDVVLEWREDDRSAESTLMADT